MYTSYLKLPSILHHVYIANCCKSFSQILNTVYLKGMAHHNYIIQVYILSTNSMHWIPAIKIHIRCWKWQGHCTFWMDNITLGGIYWSVWYYSCTKEPVVAGITLSTSLHRNTLSFLLILLLHNHKWFWILPSCFSGF